MTDIKQHEHDLLNEIGQDPMVTQANLSNRLGIAVGSVNWYIKRLILRGWVKASHLDQTRLKHDLTPEGMAVSTQRAVSYARDSLKVYSDFRNKARAAVMESKQPGIDQVYLQGNNDMMDILRLTCLEGGLAILDSPERVALKASGQDFQIAYKDADPAKRTWHCDARQHHQEKAKQ